MDEEYMRRAIAQAKQSKQYIGCGVVIVKDGHILAETYNKQKESCDATAHAEILAIRAAGGQLGQKDLDGCTVYCTCEPCTMCLSAIIFAKVPRLVYGTSMQETFPDNLPITLTSQELLAHAPHHIDIVSGYLHDECATLLSK